MTPDKIISLTIGAAGLLFGLYQYFVKGHQSHTSEITTVLISLENIKDITRKIEQSLDDIKLDVKTDHDLLIETKQSLKSAWNSINEIKNELKEIETNKNKD